jgi:hypothetical protein
MTIGVAEEAELAEVVWRSVGDGGGRRRTPAGAFLSGAVERNEGTREEKENVLSFWGVGGGGVAIGGGRGRSAADPADAFLSGAVERMSEREKRRRMS